MDSMDSKQSENACAFLAVNEKLKPLIQYAFHECNVSSNYLRYKFESSFTAQISFSVQFSGLFNVHPLIIQNCTVFSEKCISHFATLAKNTHYFPIFAEVHKQKGDSVHNHKEGSYLFHYEVVFSYKVLLAQYKCSRWKFQKYGKKLFSNATLGLMQLKFMSTKIRKEEIAIKIVFKKYLSTIKVHQNSLFLIIRHLVSSFWKKLEKRKNRMRLEEQVLRLKLKTTFWSSSG